MKGGKKRGWGGGVNAYLLFFCLPSIQTPTHLLDADAVLPNLQERLFAAGSSRLEVTYYSNIGTLMFMCFSMLISGDGVGAVTYAWKNQRAAAYLVLYTLLAYLGKQRNACSSNRLTYPPG